MLQYFLKYHERLTTALVEHLQIVGITMGISIVLAVVIAVVVSRSRILSQLAVSVLGAMYSVPSLALFALLIPFLGLGEQTAIVVLVLYNQFILVRNILAGFDSVEEAILEAAAGMGMSAWQILWKVKLPLASPAIIAGIRIAIISTIGIATIASTINAGGIGTVLFDGMRTHNNNKLLWGTILVTLLAAFANMLLTIVEKKTMKMTRGGI